MSNVLPQGWEEKKLDKIIDIIHGYAFKGKDFSNNETKYILLTPGNFKISGGFKSDKFKYYSEDAFIPNNYVLNKNDLLVTMTDLSITGDTLGYPLLVPILEDKILLHNQRLGKIKFLTDEIDKYFLYYVFCTYEYRGKVLGSATGTTVRHTAPNRILDFDCKFPSDINEQKRIADILSAFDDKIELNNQMNQTLEDMATTLFKEWFIDNESNNWEVRTLGSLGKVITGKTPSTKNKDYWGDGIFFITPTDFKNYKKYAFNSERSLSILGKESSKRIVLPKETILVTCIGSDMGKVVIAQNECISNQQINALIIDNDYLQEYVYQYLKHIYPHLRQIAMGGSTMPIINKSAFENIEIILPPIDLLKKFQDITFSFNQIIIKNTKENQTLKQQRDTLLPKLMSGEIRV